MTTPCPAISIVSPVYLSAETIPELVNRITAAVEHVTLNFEIVLVDDGSPDESWEMIHHECARDRRVKGVKLSRNFGQHFAISAGLSHAAGQAIVLMDCDLQDDPAYIPQLHAKLLEGYDIVYARRSARKYGTFKNFCSKTFYKTLSWITDFNIDPNTGIYTILSRRTVDTYLRIGDYRRGYIFILHWIGFESASVPVEHRKRSHGQSSYSFGRIFRLGMDVLLSYSDKLLLAPMYCGSIVLLVSLAYITYIFGTSDLLPGWTVVLAVLMLLGGLTMIFLGIIGLYLARIFEQVKDRPQYIVEQTENLYEAEHK
jgi:dolichol-phosphate mannosyltransferase